MQPLTPPIEFTPALAASSPLRVATDPRWAGVALGDLDRLLSDHAHCEYKAASMALSIIGRFPERSAALRPLLALAHEELHHFRQVLDLIERRGGALTPPAPDSYVRALRHRIFHAEGGLGSYGDLLIVSAFVEARSCERFSCLASALAAAEQPEQIELGKFYRTLAGAEGRHWELFRDLAIEAYGPARSLARLEQAAEIEAEIVRARPLEPRMH